MATKNATVSKGTTKDKATTGAVGAAVKGEGKEVVAPTVTQTLGNAAASLSQAVEAAKNELTQRMGLIESIHTGFGTKVDELNADYNTKLEMLTKARDDSVATETTAIDQLHATLKEMGVKIPGVRIGRVGRTPGSKNKPKAAPANGGAKARVAGEHGGGRQKNSENQSTTEFVLEMLNKSKTKQIPTADVMKGLKDSFDHPNPNSVIAYLKRTCRLVQTAARGEDYRFPTVGELKRYQSDGTLPESGPFRANSTPATIADLL